MFSLFFAKSVTLSQLDELPKNSGIYYAIAGNKVLYVGRAVNLHRRWNARGKNKHHQLHDLKKVGGVRLKYRIVGKWRLNHEEAKAIAKFDPPMNDRKESLNPWIGLFDLARTSGAVALFVLLSISIGSKVPAVEGAVEAIGGRAWIERLD